MREQEVTKRDLLFVYDVLVAKKMKEEGVDYLCTAIASGSNKRFWLFPRSERTESILLNK